MKVITRINVKVSHDKLDRKHKQPEDVWAKPGTEIDLPEERAHALVASGDAYYVESPVAKKKSVTVSPADAGGKKVNTGQPTGGKIRVNKLAKELNMKSADLVKYLTERGVVVKTHSSVITKAVADEMRKSLAKISAPTQ